jgi:hypothetical protein
MSQSGEPVCNGSICTSISVCGGGDGPPAVMTFTTVVRLDRTGDVITIRPEDSAATLRMDLRITATELAGTATGQFRDGALQVSVSGGGKPDGAATGTLLGSVSGRIDGQVSIGGYSCSNNGHAWALARR